MYSELVEKLNLSPHPEGGFYRETFRSSGKIDKGKMANHNYSTAIYYLLAPGNVSKFHRIKQEEIWHYYQGTSAVHIHYINTEGELITQKLGKNISNQEHFQVIIPANVWFAAELDNTNGWALSGCTVAPGFEFSDFEIANKIELVNQFPNLKDILIKLC